MAKAPWRSEYNLKRHQKESDTGSADYALVGEHYAALRRADPRIAALIQAQREDAKTLVNIGAGSYDMLLELQREKNAGPRQFEIGDKVLLSKHNLSRLIDRRENEQLLGRYVCAEDKRGNRTWRQAGRR